MAWTAPKTWSVGEVLTSANMNAQVRDNEKELWHRLATGTVASVTLTATAEAAPTDCITLANLVVAGYPIRLECICPAGVQNAGAANAQAVLNFWEDATNIGRCFTSPQGNGTQFPSVYCMSERTPAAGSRTYKIAGWSIPAGATFNGGSTGLDARFSVWEKGGP